MSNINQKLTITKDKQLLINQMSEEFTSAKVSLTEDETSVDVQIVDNNLEVEMIIDEEGVYLNLEIDINTTKQSDLDKINQMIHQLIKMKD